MAYSKDQYQQEEAKADVEAGFDCCIDRGMEVNPKV